jgi:hypothetical protein
MKILQDIANLITVRNFMASSVNNESIRLTREELKNVGACVKAFDQTIVSLTLKLDLALIGKEPVVKTEVRHFSATSTEDTETVMKKFSGIKKTSEQPASKVVVDEKGSTFVEAPADKE